MLTVYITKEIHLRNWKPSFLESVSLEVNPVFLNGNVRACLSTKHGGSRGSQPSWPALTPPTGPQSLGSFVFVGRMITLTSVPFTGEGGFENQIAEFRGRACTRMPKPYVSAKAVALASCTDGNHTLALTGLVSF